MNNYQYQVGGSLQVEALSYIVRQADCQLYEALLRGEFCYVFNSRQMGKSSLRVRTKHRLEESGFSCVTITMTAIGSQTVTPKQFYKGIASELHRGFGLYSQINFKIWWQQEEDLSPLQHLNLYIEDVLLSSVSTAKIFIFIDEIDSILSTSFPTDDFFALIRSFYNRRADDLKFHRLSFALFGVATPSELISDNKRTPFNIGKAIELEGFRSTEATSLAEGLASVSKHPQAVLELILTWTGGQPFLTQKLCQLVVDSTSCSYEQDLTLWLEALVIEKIIQNWESQDEPEHLKTIRDRLTQNEKQAIALLGLYRQILTSTSPIPFDGNLLQMELLLSGLVSKHRGYLQVYNPIYQRIFHLDWVDRQLAKVRIYAEAIQKWLNSDRKDPSVLLRGQALENAHIWAANQNISNEDRLFLAASEALDRQEEQINLEKQKFQEVSARLAEEQKNVRLQKLFLTAIGFALFLTTAWSFTAYLEHRKIIVEEIEAMAEHSDALFASNRKLLALMEAIKAKKRLQSYQVKSEKLKILIDRVLNQAIYGAIEYNYFLGHQGEVFGVASSQDQKFIASASSDNTAKIWYKDGTLLKTLTEHQGDVNTVAFNRDGRILATGSADNTVKIWQKEARNWQKVKLLRTFRRHADAITAIAWSPDDQILASASKDRTIELLHINGTEVATLKGHTDAVTAIAWSPDGQILASASKDRTIKLWHRNGKKITTLRGHTDTVTVIAWSPISPTPLTKGGIFASGSEDQSIKIWDRQGTLIKTLDHDSQVTALTFSADGQTIASGTINCQIKIWKKNGLLIQTIDGHEARISDLEFTSDGQILLSASDDKSIKLWRLNHDLFDVFTEHRDTISAVKFSPNGQEIVTGSWDKTVQVLNLRGLSAILKGHQDTVLTVDFSRDSQTIASGSLDKTIKIWSREKGKNFQYHSIATFYGHQDGVTAVTFSPEDGLFASASLDNTVKIWQKQGRSWEQTKLIHTLNAHSAAVMAIAFSPDGKLLASASADNTIKLWYKNDHSWQNAKLIHTFTGHNATVTTIAFSPDSKLIASSSTDNTIKLWHFDGSLLNTITDGKSPVSDLTFSPDGNILVSASMDKTIKIWKRDDRQWSKIKLQLTLYGHQSGVTGVAFQPKGKILASVSEDKNLILWDWQRNKQIDPIVYGCDWIGDFLKTNINLTSRDRFLCN